MSNFYRYMLATFIAVLFVFYLTSLVVEVGNVDFATGLFTGVIFTLLFVAALLLFDFLIRKAFEALMKIKSKKAGDKNAS